MTPPGGYLSFLKPLLPHRAKPENRFPQKAQTPLCPACTTLNLTTLAHADRDPSADLRPSRPPWPAQLGTVTAVVARAPYCTLCAFTWERCQARFGGAGSGEAQNLVPADLAEQVVIVSTRGFFQLVRDVQDARLGPDVHVRDIVLAVTPDPVNKAYDACRLATLRPLTGTGGTGGEGLCCSSGRTDDGGLELDVDVARDGFHHPGIGHARPVTPLVDIGLLRSWLDLCQDKHGDACARPYRSVLGDTASVRDFRLVDVVKRCVVDAPPGCAYVTLSYVWGGLEPLRLTKGNMERLGVEGGLDCEGESEGEVEGGGIPVTVRDAMVLVEWLGERYLWVDTLCIPQDDREVKQSLMSQMHLIYLNATMTIVAASGHDANAGLPGLHANTRTPTQLTLSLGNTSFTTAIDDAPATTLNASAWKQRGWTYEELLLSPRLLIFTATQVYWHCTSASWREEAILEHWTPSAAHASSPDVLARGQEHMPPLKTTLDAAFLRMYKQLVSAYCRRQLSHQHDKLNAFLGIQNALTHATGVTFHWGHPEVDITRSLAWSMAGARRNAERVKERGGKIDRGAAVAAAATAVTFPSWSWTGWHYPQDRDRDRHGAAGEGIRFVHQPHAELVFYRVGVDGKLCRLTEHPELDYLPGHDTFWPPGDGPKQEDWIGSPRDMTRDYVFSAPDDGRFIDSGLLRFFTRTAKLQLRRVTGNTGRRSGLLAFDFQLALPDDAGGEILSTHVNVEDASRLDGAEGGALFVEAVALGRIWSFDTVCLLTEVEPGSGVNYRLGIAVVAEESWRRVAAEWRCVTLG